MRDSLHYDTLEELVEGIAEQHLDYVPIRWNAFIDVIPVNMLRHILCKLHGKDLARGVYRIGDHSLFIEYDVKIDHELAAEYGYIPHIRIPSMTSSSTIYRQAVQGLTLDALISITNKDNHHIMMTSAIETDRLAFVKWLVERYNITKIPFTWRMGPAVYSWAVDDGLTIPKGNRLKGIVHRDDIDAYIKEGGMPIIPGIHGLIRRYIVSNTTSKDKLDQLDLDADDILHGIDRMREYYLIRAMAKGYIEILDIYMQDDELISLALNKRVTGIGIANIPGLVEYLDYRYDEPLGTWLACYTTHGDCVAMKTPGWFWRHMLIMASMYGDVHTMRNILHNHVLDKEEKDMALTVMREYLAGDKLIYGVMAGMLYG